MYNFSRQISALTVSRVCKEFLWNQPAGSPFLLLINLKVIIITKIIFVPQCSATCGPGTQKRNVECRNVTGQLSPSSEFFKIMIMMMIVTMMTVNAVTIILMPIISKVNVAVPVLRTLSNVPVLVANQVEDQDNQTAGRGLRTALMITMMSTKTRPTTKRTMTPPLTTLFSNK